MSSARQHQRLSSGSRPSCPAWLLCLACLSAILLCCQACCHLRILCQPQSTDIPLINTCPVTTPPPTALLVSGSTGSAARSKLHIFVEWLPLQELGGGEGHSAASGVHRNK